jgi:hypothetical protein
VRDEWSYSVHLFINPGTREPPRRIAFIFAASSRRRGIERTLDRRCCRTKVVAHHASKKAKIRHCSRVDEGYGSL